MWMESLEQRQLWAPLGGDFSPFLVGEGVVNHQRLAEAGPVSWVSDSPRDLAAQRRDDDGPGGVSGVVVMVL